MNTSSADGEGTPHTFTAAMQARRWGYCSVCGAYVERVANGSMLAHSHRDPWVLLRSPGDWTDGPEPERRAPLYELAASAGITRKTAWRWVEAGELGALHRPPGDRRVFVEINRFMAALKSPRRRHRR
jgi:hypothetical protein